MATSESTSPPLTEALAPNWQAQIKQRYQALSLNQRIMVGLGLMVMAGLLVFSALSSRSQQGFKVLYSNVSDADGAAIIASLQQMNVPYQFTEGGGAIMVPQSSVYETRLKLAGQGLPKGGNVGFELLENQKFGTSQFVERVNYLRGLEGELARSISSLGQVKSARVHLAVPKQTAFVREQERPSASVVVKLHAGRVLDPAQVAAIARLVSASVPGMQVQDVAIMDADGGVVSPNPLRQAGLDASQIKYTAELESALTRRLGVILEPLAGKDGFRAEVTVDMDFDEREKTSETFSKNSPPNAQSIRSQQSIDAGPARGTSGGIPGSLTNQPQQPAEAPIVNEVATPATPANANAPRNLRAPGEVETGVSVSDNTPLRSERTVNYEVDRAIERLKSSKGNVRRVSAAVILDNKLSGATKVPFTPQEITQITSLVKDAIGFQQTRGDTVSVANLPFSMEAPVETPIWTPELTSQLLSYGAIALAVLFGYFAVLRPLLRPAPPPVIEPFMPPPEPEPVVPTLSARDRLRQEIAERDEEWALQEEAWKAEAEQRERMARAEAERQTAKESQSKRLYDELLDYARGYVTQNQDKAAFLLRAWAAESKPGSGERT